MQVLDGIMTSRINLVVCLVLCSASGAISASQVSIPPRITHQSTETIYYKVNETVKIICEASGSPEPGYSWKRQKLDFNPAGNDNRITQLKNKGTLIINSPESKDEGIYQCFAKNSFGTAASIKFNLRMAKLNQFTNEDPIYHDVQLGEYLKMSCQSPDSVPDAHIYWVVVQKDNTFSVIDWNSTVSLDYEDRIHFTHVDSFSHQDGQPYRCVVYNSMMRASQVGPPHYINTRGASDQFRDISFAWPKSRFSQFGLVGSTTSLKCIFAGNPTPTVIWRRGGNKPFDNKRVVTVNSDGQEMTIKNLQFSDAGSYVCEATSRDSRTPVQMSFNLTVSSKPTWVKKPKDMVLAEGDTATFECDASGVPKPKILWFVNGVKLEVALKDDTRLKDRFKRLESTKIMLEKVTLDDAMVFQCNATNLNGYVWGEAYLNVLNEAPYILDKLEQSVKAAEGTPFELICNIYGKPDPIITWYKDGKQITGGRYKIKDSGNLHVVKSVLSDAGLFRCEAVNVFGKAEAEGYLIVRRATIIEQPPRDLEVTRNSYAKFTCSGTTDPQEVLRLKVNWLKDNKYIEMGERFFRNIQDNSLILSGAEVRDSGTYTCELTNGLDKYKKSARLEVTDIPDPPYDVKINNSCLGSSKVQILWIPGSFNNAPIQYFTIEYSTTKDPDVWAFAGKVKQSKATAIVNVYPGLSFSFRVISVNKIGASKPSVATKTRCATEDQRPKQNPRNVRTIGNLPRKIHLEWTPVPPKYQGGTNFRYHLIIKRKGVAANIFYRNHEIDNWRNSSYETIDRGVDYEAFEITLRSKNDEGDCEETPKIIIGYSAEAMPLISPSQLEVLALTYDHVQLQWNFPRREINRLGTKIKGEFNGFQVQIWVESRRKMTINQWMIPASDFGSQRGDNFNTTIRHMMPNGNLMATVAVMNNFFIGTPSESLRFKSLPGLPGPVRYLYVEVIGDNHITLEWGHPLDNSDDVLGYDIGYQKVLEPPRFSVANVGHTHVNITWWVDQHKQTNSLIYAQYKKEDGGEWFSTSPSITKSWIDIKELEPGTDYQVRVVVVSGNKRRVSIEADVQTEGDAVAYDVVANLGWFLGMIFSLVLHIALIILFAICYSKGFRFSGRHKQEAQTYKSGSDTITGTSSNVEQFANKSEGLGPEPRGHTNDYYDERDSYEYKEGDQQYVDFDDRVEKPPLEDGDNVYEPYNYDNDYDDSEDYPPKAGAYSSEGSNDYPPRDRYAYDNREDYNNGERWQDHNESRGDYDNSGRYGDYDDRYDDGYNASRSHTDYHNGDYSGNYDHGDYDDNYSHRPHDSHDRYRDVVDEVNNRLSREDQRGRNGPPNDETASSYV